MRQVGILAAAGLIALEDGPNRLHKDHENAKRLAAGLSEIPGIKLDAEKVVTNIVIFDISDTGMDPTEISAKLKHKGVLAIGFGKSMRMVTHRDVSKDDIEESLQAMRSVLKG